MTCFLGNQELAFRGHDESAMSANKGTYVELANLLKQFDEVMQNNLSGDSSSSRRRFTGMSSHVQNDLISSVSRAIQAEVVKQLDSCKFASILVDESTDVAYD